MLADKAFKRLELEISWRKDKSDWKESRCSHLQAGFIRTKRSWYTIEPVAGHDFTKETEHPHVVYKKRPDEFGRNAEILCNVTGNMAKTIAKRAFSSQKRHPPKNQANSHTMELLLVLDKTVLDYHKDFDVENYVLTLLNMVPNFALVSP